MFELAVYVQPGAKTRSVGGSFDGVLKVAVTARAVEGAATAEVLEVVAEAFSLKRRQVTLRRGERSRHKLLLLEGDAAILSELAEALRSRAAT